MKPLAILGAAAALAATTATSAFAADAPARPRVPGGIGFALAIDPPSVLFGDPVTAAAEVVLDPRFVSPESVRVQAAFLPYRLVGRPAVTRSEARGIVTLRVKYRLLCLQRACRPGVGEVRTFRFGQGTVTFGRIGGGSGRLQLRWFPLTVASRLSTDTAQRVGLQARPYPPPPADYAVDPTRLSALLFGLAAVLAALGAVLLWRALGPHLRARLTGRRVARFRPVEREIALLRDAVARGEAGAQRRALDGLAVALGGNGSDDLALGARQLAWSELPPAPEAALALADRAETEVAPVRR